MKYLGNLSKEYGEKIDKIIVTVVFERVLEIDDGKRIEENDILLHSDILGIWEIDEIHNKYLYKNQEYRETIANYDNRNNKVVIVERKADLRFDDDFGEFSEKFSSHLDYTTVCIIDYETITWEHIGANNDRKISVSNYSLIDGNTIQRS